MAAYLHGCRIIEDDSGPRPIQTVSSSVIGIAGTAPNAEGETAASVTVGQGKAGLVFTAKEKGNSGNAIRVEYIVPPANSSALAVTVTGTIIKISLATDDKGEVTSTAADIKTAVNAAQDAPATAETLEDGSAVVVTAGVFYLADGQDEPFPLNKPVALSASEASKIRKLGGSGTLPWIMDTIARFGGHLCVVVRVKEGDDDSDTANNIAGSASNGTGLWALLNAQSVTGFEPRILGAPGFTHEQFVADALFTVAERCRGYGYADCAETATQAQAFQYRQKFGAEFGMLLWPYVWVQDTNTGQKVKRPLSAFALGLRAAVDNDRGWHWPMSNHEITGILEPVTPVSYRIDDPNSTANQMNQNHITTVVNTGSGFVLWGVRSLTTDVTKHFENWGRAKGVIYDSLLRSHQWAMDRLITTTYVDDVTGGVNDFLADLTAKGYLLNGRCWADPEINNQGSIFLGKFFWNFDYAVPAPAEQLGFVSNPQNQDYFSEVV